MGRLETAQQLVEGVKHLLGQTLADFVLILAAFCEQASEAFALWQRKQASLVQEQAQGGADGTPRSQKHIGDPEVHPARTFATGSRDKTQGATVEEQPGRNCRGA